MEQFKKNQLIKQKEDICNLGIGHSELIISNGDPYSLWHLIRHLIIRAGHHHK